MKNIKNAINEQQIQEWKNKWGKIYKTTIGEDVIVWRKLKRKEYVEIMSGADEEDEDFYGAKIYKRQDKIAEKVILYPENAKEMMEDNAGVSTTIADEVLVKSGFDQTETEEL